MLQNENTQIRAKKKAAPRADAAFKGGNAIYENNPLQGKYALFLNPLCHRNVMSALFLDQSNKTTSLTIDVDQSISAIIGAASAIAPGRGVRGQRSGGKNRLT